MQDFFPPLSCIDMPDQQVVSCALVMDGDQLGFDVLNQRSYVIAENMQRLGVKKESPLGVLARSQELIAWMVYAGRVYGVAILPLDAGMDSERRDKLLSECGCSQLVVEEGYQDLPAGINSFLASEVLSGLEQVHTQSYDCSQGGSSTQLIIATSGSEGNPKGVMLSGANLAASAQAVLAYLDLGRDDTWLCCLPLNHIGGVSILYRCWYAGACALLHQGFDVELVWNDLHEYKVTHISLVPAMLSSLLDMAAEDGPPKSLKVALIGGGPLDSGLASRAKGLGWPICVSYGMSETASICVGDNGPEAGLMKGKVGRPIGDFEMELSSHGRVRLHGSAVMQGYANPGLAPGVGLDPGGWFESGDLGEIDKSGGLRILGRADDVLVSGGRNIHPAEVEPLLLDCPGVERVAVTGVSSSQWGDVLIALYTGSVTSSELDAWCRNNIPSTMRPRRFQQVTELPMNHMGKVVRDRLAEMIRLKD